jgi:predicted NUDIX family phosphoesterase
VSENILVFPAEVLDSVGYFNGFSKDVQKYTKAIFESGKMFFTSKGPAETNPNIKQLIPYIVIKKQYRYFVYRRTKECGEPKLHNLLSLGIGGHINNTDVNVTLDLLNLESNLKLENQVLTYFGGLLREVKEELNTVPDFFENLFYIRGLLYNNANLLGQVHFGLIHIAELNADIDFKTDNTIQSVGFLDIDTIKSYKNEFEDWSQLVIDNLL